MYYYPDLIVSNLFYCTCTIRADVSAPCACLSCSLAFLLLYVVFLSKYMMMMTLSVSGTVLEILAWPWILVKGYSRCLKMVPFESLVRFPIRILWPYLQPFRHSTRTWRTDTRRRHLRMHRATIKIVYTSYTCVVSHRMDAMLCYDTTWRPFWLWNVHNSRRDIVESHHYVQSRRGGSRNLR